MKILANDGIAPEGQKALEAQGFEVFTEKIAQEDLPHRVGEYDVLIVRSATKVTREVLSNPGKLRLVVRAGVGIDNIDQQAAAEKGIEVRNTPNSASLSVAELAIAHAYALARYIHQSNRKMPVSGGAPGFKELKKKYEKGTELRGKTMGIVGFGRIGQETAKLAICNGMKVLVFNRTPRTVTLTFDHLPFDPAPQVDIATMGFDEVISQSDYVSLHVPGGGGPPLIDRRALGLMKKGAAIINCARGGVVDETALLEFIQKGHVSAAALDVFEGEPNVRPEVLSTEALSLTPHIGASTREAQERVSMEVAETVTDFMLNHKTINA